jgi:hypothetical protein
MIASLVLAASLLETEPPSFRERLAWYGSPTVADVVTTHLALERGRVEGNPFMGSRPLALGLQAASVPALAWLDGELWKRSPALAWALRGLRIAAAAWALAANLRAGPPGGRR